MTGVDREVLDREQVAVACRLLALEGYDDLTLGHVSVRSTAGNQVLIKRKGPALSEVEADDVVTVKLDDPGLLATPGIHLETALHTEVYKRRADVGSVIHGHPPYATAFGATGAELQMLTHDSAMFVEGVARYTATSEMITTAERAAEVAEALGQCRVVVLRNHGVLVVGKDVRWAVLAAVTFERAVRLQAIASDLGELEPIDPQILEQLHDTKYQDRFLDEYWSLWERRVSRAERGGELPRRSR